MPGGSGQQSGNNGLDSSRQPVGTQRQKQPTNGYYSTGSSNTVATQTTINSSSSSLSSPPMTTATFSRRIGSSRQNDPVENEKLVPATSGTQSGPTAARAKSAAAGPKLARDLSNLIDLMPPLSIEPGTKRLILAKKLDRENLDRYMQAGGYQTSSSSGSLSLTSSASLTVHIKCQLRERSSPELSSQFNATSSNTTASKPKPVGSTKNSNSANSILIPVHLIVTDENDNWPNFIGSPYVIDLNESAQIGSLLQNNEIVAVDNDQQGPLSTIEYSIVAGSYWSDSFSFLNPLDSRSLVVKDNRLLDFESQSKITLRVMASDQGDPPNWAITSLYINLMDQDDTDPVFNEDKYLGAVKDNRPGEMIELSPRRMIARDGDRNLNSAIVYSFHVKTNHSVHFDLDPDLGRLSLKKSLPEESAPSLRQPFCLLVRATQVDNPNRWTLSMINVRPPKVSTAAGQLMEELLAMQKEPLTPGTASNYSSSSTSLSPSSFKFPQASYAVEVSEAAPVGSTILTVRAHWTGAREHLPQDGAIAYQLLDNEQAYFSLDHHTARLTLNRSIDYEMFRQMSVRILATYEQFDDSAGDDARGSSMGALPKLVCDITRINVNIVNQNEYTPEFSHEQYNFQLSVSDLIANFDQSRSFANDEETSFSSSGAARVGGSKFSKRFGDIPEQNGAEDPLDDLGYKALQLGQVFCADRDHGDKVTLQLTGSKANLFYLTQDGRLYLPLVNVSTIPTIASVASGDSPSSAQSYSWPQSQKSINNQFMLSRLFGTRRSDQSLSLETMDRNYLNFLLGELSNLGRLRLKVMAHDDGRPDSKQSTALIVVSIISIDNFILQRAPQLAASAGGGHPADAAASQLSNEASYETFNRPEGATDGDQPIKQQVMMIPSANGKSFVQINADIIGNLLSSHSGISQSSNRSSDVVLVAKSDSLDSAASNTVAHHSIGSGEPSSQSLAGGPAARFHQQPPSLLLVDDDGAKFVAMPAAIEVYNQQVQEAAAGQLARQRGQGYLNERKSTRHHEGTSMWALWKSLFGFGDHNNNNNNNNNNNAQKQPATGALYWVNLSTAILLHLAVLVVIITLLSRLRWSFRTSSCQSQESNLSNSSLWPRRLPKLSFLHNANNNSNATAVDMLDHASSSQGEAPYMISGADCGDRYNFAHQRDTGPGDLQSGGGDRSNLTSYQSRRQQSTSSGVVVSAISKGYKSGSNAANSPTTTTASSGSNLKQHNLFDHLKLTINRMLDTRDKVSCIEGHVSIKPLDTESELFTSCNRVDYSHQVAASPQNFATSATCESSKPTATSDNINQLESTGKSISTFVGSSSPQKHRRIVKTSQKEEKNAAVVSISVKAPPKTSIDTDPSSGGRLVMAPGRGGGGVGQSAHSNSSSVVSLVSMSSSISNKISAAVVHSANSDTSSIDSSTLFNGRQLADKKKAPKSSTSCATPPAPPPLPPPPALVQVRVDCSSSSTSSPMQACKPSSGQQTVAATPQLSIMNHRQDLPQNPVHVKLRQQALSEQMVGAGDSSKSGNNGRASSARLQHQQQSVPSSTGGRREARAQAGIEHRALPPTPPPLPANGIIPATKTVSPTTSVDRGYESFQSYTSSSQQVAKYRQSNQFSSLQEYDLVGKPSYAPANASSKLNKTSHQTSFVANDNNGRLNGRLAASTGKLRSSHPNDGRPTNKTGRLGECDTEDDDFYYCDNSNALAPTVEGALTGQAGHLGAIGNLLSDYASHTYKQQPVATGGNKCRATSQQKHQLHLQANKQQARKQRPLQADQQLQTRALVQCRSANSYQFAGNPSRTTSDLNPSSSSSLASSSSAASTSSPSFSPQGGIYNNNNNNNSGSHQNESYHQNGCDILAQVNHSTSYQNYQHHSSGKHHHHHHHSLACNPVNSNGNHHQHHNQRHHLHNAHSQHQQHQQHNLNQAQNYHHHHQHHQSLPANPQATGGGGGKKQLTWSDQVEMAA